MKFPSIAIGIFAANWLVSSVGAGVAIDGDCNVGKQGVLESNLDPIAIETDAGCNS